MILKRWSKALWGDGMRVYSSTLQEFQRRLLTNDLFEDLAANYPNVVGCSVSASEANSWRTSLPRLEAILRLAALPPDSWITIEEGIPYFAKRIDVALFGHDGNGSSNVVIVELKAWTDAVALDDENVQTQIAATLVSVPHPSLQVRGYHDHLLDFCRAFQLDAPILLSSCAYCHNYIGHHPDDGLFHYKFDEIQSISPTFGSRDAMQLAEFLRLRLSGGNGRSVVDRYDKDGIGPSKQLIGYAHEMINRQNVFRLLDEQIAVNNSIMHALRTSTRRIGKRKVIFVRGGAGTGKSVIALNALGEILRRNLRVYLVSGSAAFTYGVRRLLGRRLEGLVKFTDYFWNFEENSSDVLIVDEAHRIRDRSKPRVPLALRPQISQVEELMRAARVVLFFADENQIISPDETGEPEVIREAASKVHADFEEYSLVSQFRCNGSSVYLDWLSDTLGLTPHDEGLKLVVPIGFQFKIVKTPQELWSEIQDINHQRLNSARLVAGWCWPWSNPNPDGSLVEDIIIGDFRFPWEAKNRSRPAPGIPEARWWAIDPGGVSQAGTVYSVQGFEASHIGVIIGPDLVIRGGQWIARPNFNYSNSIRGQSPEKALPYLKRIYRTLLSRAMQSCSVYCIDEETRTYFESRIQSTESGSHRGATIC